MGKVICERALSLIFDARLNSFWGKCELGPKGGSLQIPDAHNAVSSELSFMYPIFATYYVYLKQAQCNLIVCYLVLKNLLLYQ